MVSTIKQVIAANMHKSAGAHHGSRGRESLQLVDEEEAERLAELHEQ